RLLPPGIERTKTGYHAHVCITQAGKRHRFSKRFPPETSLNVIKSWRNQKRVDMERRIGLGIPGLPPSEIPQRCSPSGWCYIYFIQVDGFIKIGRTIDVRDRLHHIKTTNASTVHFLAAVLAHPNLEQPIHDRFHHLKRQGEWYAFEPELRQFIEEIQKG